MDYQAAYDRLIANARDRLTTTKYSEWHHVVPTSMGGRDHSSNIVLLTAREHYLAHLLLYRLGNANQIFSVWAIVSDRKNPGRHCLRIKRWVRKWHNRELQRLHREHNRKRLLGID